MAADIALLIRNDPYVDSWLGRPYKNWYLEEKTPVTQYFTRIGHVSSDGQVEQETLLAFYRSLKRSVLPRRPIATFGNKTVMLSPSHRLGEYIDKNIPARYISAVYQVGSTLMSVELAGQELTKSPNGRIDPKDLLWIELQLTPRDQQLEERIERIAARHGIVFPNCEGAELLY